MTPLPYRVVARREDTADTVTLTLEPVGDRLPPWAPGQFTMASAFGVGEIPISISGGRHGLIRHTVRAVGAVSQAICAAPVGSALGLRGPFGLGWPAPPDGVDVVVMAGGIGLAPLRPIVSATLGPRLTVLIGAKTPAELIFTPEYDTWRAAGADVRVSVDWPDAGWTGRVGLVTELLDSAPAPGAVGYVCGPEIMMTRSAESLVERGVWPDRVFLSLERNMRCGEGTCGHCQLGPMLVCRDGPVLTFDAAQPLLAVREL